MPLLAPPRDVQYQQKSNADFYRVAFRRIPLYKRVRDVSVDVDDLYLEVPDQDLRAGERYDIPAYVRLNPQKGEWTKFGVNEARDIKMLYSLEILKRGYIPKGETSPVPFPTPQRGDAVELEGELYILTNLQFVNYFGNTEDRMTLVAFGIKYKPSSMRGREFKVKTEGVQPTTETYKSYSDRLSK